jgi:hypothetical protein
MPTILVLIKNNLTHNTVIKLFSLIIGYGIWSFFTQHQTMDLWLTVPLCFYGAQKHITAPDSIAVQIAGKREHLSLIDLESLAIHINTRSLHAGPNPIKLKQSDLFLPPVINVLNWYPSNVTITVLEDQIHPPIEKAL